MGAYVLRSFLVRSQATPFRIVRGIPLVLASPFYVVAGVVLSDALKPVMSDAMGVVLGVNIAVGIL